MVPDLHSLYLQHLEILSSKKTAEEQAYGGGTPVDLGSLQPGDLIFYSDGGYIGHVSIYIGNGQVVHASSPSTGIIVSDRSYRSEASAMRYY